MANFNRRRLPDHVYKQLRRLDIQNCLLNSTRKNLIGQKFDWAKFDFDLITSVLWANTYQFSHVRFLVLLLFVVSWLCDLMVANTSHCHFSNALSI